MGTACQPCAVQLLMTAKKITIKKQVCKTVTEKNPAFAQLLCISHSKMAAPRSETTKKPYFPATVGLGGGLHSVKTLLCRGRQERVSK